MAFSICYSLQVVVTFLSISLHCLAVMIIAISSLFVAVVGRSTVAAKAMYVYSTTTNKTTWASCAYGWTTKPSV